MSVLIGQKLVENTKIKKFKCGILSNFQTMCIRYTYITSYLHSTHLHLGAKIVITYCWFVSQVFFCLLCKKSIVEEKSHSINHKAVVIQACIFITTLDTVCNNIAINVRLLSWEEHKKEETTSLLLNRLWIGSTRIPYSALYCKRGYRRSLRWWWGCLQSLGGILADYISNKMCTSSDTFSPKNWVTALNCSHGRFRPEDVSDTSSSLLSHNSEEDESLEQPNGFSHHHHHRDFNHHNSRHYINGNGSLHAR